MWGNEPLFTFPKWLRVTLVFCTLPALIIGIIIAWSLSLVSEIRGKES